MAHILIIGAGPLPGPEEKYTSAESLRTWQIAKPLFESPHTVRLIALPDEIQPEGIKRGGEQSLEHEGYTYLMPPASDAPRSIAYIQRAIDEFQPSCIIATGSYPSWIAAQVPTKLPLWADLPGMALAGAQVLAQRVAKERPVELAWEREKTILRRADKLSAVSMPHLYALLGQLGTLGRMNRFTASYHLVHHVPNAVHSFFSRQPLPGTSKSLRGERVPSDAFIILWSGSFNSAADAETLNSALQIAMAANPKIHFVLTGGAAEGHDELAYLEFTSAVEAGPFAERHHFMGWLEVGQLPQIYREADLGLSVDGMHYETLFGSRFRLLNMMAAGLPVATTLGAEISHVLKEEQIGLTFDAGDAEGLAEVLLDAARNPSNLHAMGQKARGYVSRHFAASALCRPIREWVDQPELAPDNMHKARAAGENRRLQDIALNEIEKVYGAKETNLTGGGISDGEKRGAGVALGEIKQSAFRFFRRRK